METQKHRATRLYELHRHRLFGDQAPPHDWGSGGSWNQRALEWACDALTGVDGGLRHFFEQEENTGHQGVETGSLTYAHDYEQAVAAACHLEPPFRFRAQKWFRRHAWLLGQHLHKSVSDWSGVETVIPGARMGDRDSTSTKATLAELGVPGISRAPERWWTVAEAGHVYRYGAVIVRDMVAKGWLPKVGVGFGIDGPPPDDLRLGQPMAILFWPGGARASIMVKGVAAWDNPVVATSGRMRLGPMPPYWPTTPVRVVLVGDRTIRAGCEGLVSEGSRQRSKRQDWSGSIDLPGPISPTSGWLLSDEPPRQITGSEVAAMLRGETTDPVDPPDPVEPDEPDEPDPTPGWPPPPLGDNDPGSHLAMAVAALRARAQGAVHPVPGGSHVVDARWNIDAHERLTR